MKKLVTSLFVISFVVVTMFSLTACGGKTAPYISKKSETHSATSATITVSVANPTNDIYDVTINVSATWTYKGIMSSNGNASKSTSMPCPPGTGAGGTWTLTNPKVTPTGEYKKFSWSASITYTKRAAPVDNPPTGESYTYEVLVEWYSPYTKVWNEFEGQAGQNYYNQYSKNQTIYPSTDGYPVIELTEAQFIARTTDTFFQRFAQGIWNTLSTYSMDGRKYADWCLESYIPATDLSALPNNQQFTLRYTPA